VLGKRHGQVSPTTAQRVRDAMDPQRHSPSRHSDVVYLVDADGFTPVGRNSKPIKVKSHRPSSAERSGGYLPLPQRPASPGPSGSSAQ
jgi:hypothetical protein